MHRSGAFLYVRYSFLFIDKCKIPTSRHWCVHIWNMFFCLHLFYKNFANVIVFFIDRLPVSLSKVTLFKLSTIRCTVHCTLGYYDFYILILPGHWWLQNLIPRHIYKRSFSIFSSRYVRYAKFVKSANMIPPQKKFVLKINIGINKSWIWCWFSNLLKKL